MLSPLISQSSIIFQIRVAARIPWSVVISMPATQPYFSFPISGWLQKEFPEIVYDRILPCHVHWLSSIWNMLISVVNKGLIQWPLQRHQRCRSLTGLVPYLQILCIVYQRHPEFSRTSQTMLISYVWATTLLVFGPCLVFLGPSAMRPFIPSKGCQFFQYFCNRRNCVQSDLEPVIPQV